MDTRSVRLFGIKFNLKKSIKRLQRDMRDDWFPDFLDYKDIFHDEAFFLYKLKDYIDTDKKYQASPALHIDIPKPGFTLRYSSETNIIDRLIYQASIDIIANKFDDIHSARIYSHRVNKAEDEKYFFQYAVEEWKKFLLDVETELNTDGNEVLLVTDLSNYYESISIKDLIITLKLLVTNLSLSIEEKDIFTKVINLINDLLSAWCQPDTKRGIPQNRDASSFLSNIFLSPVDNEIIKSGYNYFRYMDDIRIVCKDKYEARKALKLLISELRKKGLNVNSKKTQILDLNNPDQNSIAKDILQESDHKIDQIQGLLNSKKARGVQVAVPMLRKKTMDLIESDGTLKRHFRFCINRLESLNRIPEIKPLLQLDEITDFIINELVSQPWSTDTFSRYLTSVELTNTQLEKIKSIITDHDKNIYEWQEYHLWKILIGHQYSNLDLVLTARENILRGINNSPVIAGSALYLCALGDSNDKKYVVDNFKFLKDHITQRAALIGIKDLDYSYFIKPAVEKFILPCVQGCYKNLNEHYKQEYINKPHSLNYKNFCDEVPEFIS